MLLVLVVTLGGFWVCLGFIAFCGVGIIYGSEGLGFWSFSFLGRFLDCSGFVWIFAVWWIWLG